jgi:hydroxyethylthiazole kinase-like uncharacterized protein yjeF
MNANVAKTLLHAGLAVHQIHGVEGSSSDHFYIEACEPLHIFRVAMPLSTHKGHFGTVAIFEGEYTGAARLAGHAALRVGAGKVVIQTSSSNYMPAHFIASGELDLARIQCLIIGPGLGNKSHQEKARTLLDKALGQVPHIVLDAEALDFIQHGTDFKQSSVVLTPHPGEAARLLGVSTETIEENRFQAIEKLAQINIKGAGEIVWILKGANSLVWEKSAGIFSFAGDLPPLSTGGSGDILAGAIAGLSKQTHTLLAATLLAISYQVSAGRKLLAISPRGFLPEEIADCFTELNASGPYSVVTPKKKPRH